MTLRKNRTKARIALATLVAVGATSVAFAVPASAAGSLSGYCNAGQVCMFMDSYYEKGIAGYAGNDTNYSGNYFDHYDGGPIPYLNDATSSIYNHGSSCNTRHYTNASYGGSSFLTTRNYYYPTISYNDQLSSHKWVC